MASPGTSVTAAVADRPSHVPSVLTWHVDPAASKGELSTRHWLWGWRSVPLSVSAGRLLRDVDGLRKLELTMQFAIRDGDTLEAVFSSGKFEREHNGRFVVSGRLSMQGTTEDAELLLHNLGRGSSSTGNERWFATIAGRLPLSAASQRVWNRLLTGPHLSVYAHTEWLPSAAGSSSA